MPEPLQPQGTFGVAPPNAPHETTQPLQPGTLSEQIALARANERELKPLAPSAPLQTEAVLAFMGNVHPDSPNPNQTAVLTEIQEVVDPPRVNPMPAASDTDSPSRGIPRPIADPGKRITGGFGDTGEAQYYALDGSELLELVRHLMDELNQRIENDLRFHMAITYPRVSARVLIEVEGYASQGDFSIVKHLLPGGKHDKTPVEIARQHADEVCFVVSAQRQEFNAAGEPENPPDRIRDELGLEKPRKQMIQAGASRIMVDRGTNLDGSF